LPEPEGTRSESPIYTTAGLGAELRQSEILSNLFQYTVDPVAGSASYVIHDYAIILTQDCDLLWDYEARQTDKDPLLNGVLVFEAETVDQFRPKVPPGRDIWKRIIDNRDERYHFLESIPESQDLLGAGIAALAVDFKRFFTVAAVEIERQFGVAAGAKRRCRLEMPYREHLQARAAYYFQRVMLPLPHIS
jgi:hypothetical protein